VPGQLQPGVQAFLPLATAVFEASKEPRPHGQGIEGSLGKRLTLSPKLYLNDSGLLAHLAGTDAGAIVHRPSDLAPVAETFVVMELMKMAPGSVAHPRLFHFRTSAGQEVECGLVLHTGKEILPFGPRLCAAPIQALWAHPR
jgi:hypothetical protein